MTFRLPDSLTVIQRGWLSANTVLGFEGKRATLVDTGYVSEARQTVSLIAEALAGRRLERIINTHSHSDHMGGNAAVQAAFGGSIMVPAGLQAAIADWDEEALLLSPLGQQATPFRHDELIGADNTFSMGDLVWRSIAVPGHDMAALAFYNPEHRLLISGDALWENGFGIAFPELLGEADGLAATRETLETLARLPIDGVIPGHGAPFSTVDQALTRAFRRLESYEANLDTLVWYAVKAIVSFAFMEKGRLPAGDFPAFVLTLPFALDVSARYLGLTPDRLAERVEIALLQAGAIHREGEWLCSAHLT